MTFEQEIHDIISQRIMDDPDRVERVLTRSDLWAIRYCIKIGYSVLRAYEDVIIVPEATIAEAYLYSGSFLTKIKQRRAKTSRTNGGQ